MFATFLKASPVVKSLRMIQPLLVHGLLFVSFIKPVVSDFLNFLLLSEVGDNVVAVGAGGVLAKRVEGLNASGDLVEIGPVLELIGIDWLAVHEVVG